jgi:ribonuclease BN (tRNA processing enzyme)
MKLTFLGTRGYIERRTKTHYRHAATLIIHRNKKIMIDCGLDWHKQVWRIKPNAIIITHAHPDHAFGLKNGSPCPVYATRATWKLIKNFLIAEPLRHTIFLTKPLTLFGVRFRALANVHSVIAPAISLLIKNNHKKSIFYAGDIAYLPHFKRALKKVTLFIADGSTVTQSLIRKRNGILYGHASISAQLTWCKKSGIKQMIVTHCGNQIVAQSRTSTNQIRQLAKLKNINVTIAHDGFTTKI